MKIIKGNILNDLSTNIVICQQVNCKGVMGAGLAKQIRDLFPHMYHMYKNYCYKYGSKLLGMVFLYTIPSTHNRIANLFGQDNYGRDKQYTDYNALRSAFRYLRSSVTNHFTIRIPFKIGCGLAGGDWDVVSKIIQEELVAYDYNVEIFRL